MGYVRNTLTAVGLALAIGCTTVQQGPTPEEQRLARENERLARENREMRQGLADIADINSRYGYLVRNLNVAEFNRGVAQLRTELKTYVDQRNTPLDTMATDALIRSRQALEAADSLRSARESFERQVDSISTIDSSVANVRQRHYDLQVGLDNQRRYDQEVQRVHESYQARIDTLEQNRAGYSRSNDHSFTEKEKNAREATTQIDALRLEEKAAIANIPVAAPRRGDR